MHQYKVRRIIPSELNAAGWYVTCQSCSWKHTESISTYELAMALGHVHQVKVQRTNQRIAWRKLRLLPPSWAISKNGMVHYLIPARHLKKASDAHRTMCGGIMRERGGYVAKGICLRCALKCNRWLVFIVQVATPLDTKLQRKLGEAVIAADRSRINEQKAIIENHRLVNLIAGAQSEINALRHYISFAVDKLYAEHGLKAPTPPEPVVDISKREVKQV